MIEWRFVAADFGHVLMPDGQLSGPAAVTGQGGLEARPRAAWARPRITVLAGEEPSPMVRTMLVADSGSGVGAALPASGFTFINVDLTVALHRDPAGEWVLLEASTVIDASGTGLATTRIADAVGSAGSAMQTLLVAPRPDRP